MRILLIPMIPMLVAMAILEVSIVTWGSVVVFGAYEDWTWNYEEKLRSKDWTFEERQKIIDNYCRHTPMIFALVILIFEWVRSEQHLLNINLFLLEKF